jgi:small subunit ribosomal protein S16
VVRIRLRRIGAKRQPSYRLIVADAESPRDGRFIENIGFYNPRTQPETLTVDEERVLHWLGTGAQPSESALKLLTRHGTMARFRRLKSGEPVETLVEEARQAAEAKGTVDPKTRLRPTAPQPAAVVTE